MSFGVAVIGAGPMGEDRARRIEQEIKGAHLAVVSDIDADRAAQCVGVTGSATARYVKDPEAAIADAAVDAVIIAAPDRFHVPLTLAALRTGKPVLCEKPLAPTAAECLEVLDLEASLSGTANRARVTLGFMRRFDPGCVELRQTVTSDEFGPALMLHCVHRNVDAYPGGSEHTINASAVHEFDFVPWLLGSGIKSVPWHGGRSSTRTARQDPQFVLLETEDGVLTTLELFVSAKYGYEVRCELVCEEGTRELHTAAPTTVRHDRALGTRLPPDATLKYAEAYRGELRAWVSSLETGRDPSEFGLATAWDGYLTAAVSDAVLESMRAGDGHRVSIASVPIPGLYGLPQGTSAAVA
ncbi:Gfo/Idh/MocA family oxidoreductase [Streptomyces sp. NPDC046915]|uniref:Gfo/Idh/MocA family protein n=1 Tax=Streptomyces sp. NPDC046915 TaxID=3155257 RepID=UPI0033F8EC63